MASRKLIGLTLCCLALMAGSSSAREHYWFNDAGTKLWSDSGNWWRNDGTIPTIADEVSIDYPIPTECNIPNDANCYALYVGDWSQEDPNWAMLSIIDDGNLVVETSVSIGVMATKWNDMTQAMGDVNVVDGNVSVGTDFFIGREGLAILNMRGGTLTIAGTLWCPGGPLPWYATQNYQAGTAEGHLNLHGGTITAGDIDVYRFDTTQMDIMDGTLIINGDQVSKLRGWTSEGKLFAYDGRGELEIDYNVRNASKTTVTASFDPNLAWGPSPLGYSENVALDANLSWSPGDLAAEHDVYFGTNFNDVNNAADPCTLPGRGRQSNTTYNPSLVSGQTYFWRIDEANDVNVWKGYVWQFKAERVELARYPAPADDAYDTPVNVTLTWTPGIYADTHDVYLGTSFNDVNDANTSTVGIYKTNRDVNNYVPSLAFGQTHFWRIDEVNDSNSDLWKGDVWSFTTSESLVIDDFSPPQTWTTAAGFGTFGTSTDNPPIQSGAAGLFDYDNRFPTDYYSELECSLPSGLRDWTIAGAEILALSYHGKPGNDPEWMYVVVQDVCDSTVELALEPNDIIQELGEYWKRWRIDLNQLAGSVDLTQIKKLIIGFGDRNDPNAAGYGGVYIDDIELQPPICYNQDDDGDFDNDCFVDVNDLVIISRDWLESDYDVNATTASSTGLVVWYKFDEGSGWDAFDSSGNGHDGVLNLNNWDVGYDGNAVLFDYGDEVYVDMPFVVIDSNLGGESTVAFWIKDNGLPAGSDGMCLFQIGQGQRGAARVYSEQSGQMRYTCGWDFEQAEQEELDWGTLGYANPGHIQGQWNHYAFVKKASEGLMRIYHNGEIVAEHEYATATRMQVDPVEGEDRPTIGAYRWKNDPVKGFYDGLMDDFRLYDRALSHGEILDLADVTSMHQPLVSYAEVVADDTVNFKDFAVMAALWLEAALWP